MYSSIRAMRAVFNTLLSLVELVIGLGVLIKVFGSDDSIWGLLEGVGDMIAQTGYAIAGTADYIKLDRSVTILVLFAGFLVLSYVLVMVVPVMLENKEREMEIENEFEI